MAATVVINRYTGAGPTATPITANTVVTANDLPQILASASAVGVADPIQIPPGAGTNYSFWCTTGLEVTVAPSTAINNVRWYTDGADGFGTGVSCVYGSAPANGLVRASYDQATGATSTGDELAANHTTISATASPFTFTSGSPLTIGNGSIGAATGALGNFIVYQFQVIQTALPGPTNQETFTWAFDES